MICEGLPPCPAKLCGGACANRPSPPSIQIKPTPSRAVEGRVCGAIDLDVASPLPEDPVGGAGVERLGDPTPDC